MEENKPLISVVIPVYKVEQYLDRCMNSIVNQTYKNLEIILVNDGSPDRCPQMCDEWAKKDKRIRVIHKENGGLSSARNVGLNICKGRYVNFVDSDDWIPENSIQYLCDLRKKYEADFAIASHIRTCGQEYLTENDYAEYELTQREFLARFFKISTQENVQYAWAKLYKRELFNVIRYPVGLTCEDIPVTFQVALRSKKIAYSTNIVYFYYFNPGSITRIGFSNQKFDIIKAWDVVCQNAYQSGEKWIIAAALSNRKRADFGILMDLAISNITLKEKFKYLPRLKENRAALKKNMFELCKAKIPLSRKIFIICFSRNYQVCLYALHFISKLKYRMTKKRNKEV